MWLESKVCVVCSPGGHLTEALLACRLIPKQEQFYVTHRLPHLEGSLEDFEHYYLLDPHRSIWKFCITLFQSTVLFWKTRPAIIITTGAGIAVPLCLLGKLCGTKLVFVEISARVRHPSLTGRLLSRIADLTLVQWEELLEVYPHAQYGGLLL